MTSEERIKTWWTTRNHASGYITDEVKLLLDEHAAEARADQREACSEAVSKELVKRDWVIKSDKHLREACLNAVEKSDE